MKLARYIRMLEGKLDDLGDVDVAFTQSGYYSDGPFADIHSDPVMEDVVIDAYRDTETTKRFLVLGNSHQSY